MRKIKDKLLFIILLAATVVFIAGGIVTSAPNGYRVIAWNDLGMHCACPESEYYIILPPFNTLRAQVLQTGSSIPTVVSSGVTVSYALVEDTDAVYKSDPYTSNWITYWPQLFPGGSMVNANGNIQGLTGKMLADTMDYNALHRSYEAPGIPAFPVVTGTAADIMTDPLGGPNRDPYITANITVKDTTGTIVATTSTVVPVAFGGCCTCHIKLAAASGYPATPGGSFLNIGRLHYTNRSKINIAEISPQNNGIGGRIRCSYCHWDPAMGETKAMGIGYYWPNWGLIPGAKTKYSAVRTSTETFSQALHGFHATNSTVISYDPNIATNCYDCHPGNGVNCYRGAHKKLSTMWCTDCHGNLNQRIATNQLQKPWDQSTLPTCNAPSSGITSAFACHPSTTYPNTTATWTGSAPSPNFGNFNNSAGHVSGGQILCSTCHGSPHGLAPSTFTNDNVQLQNIQTGGTFPAGIDATYPLGICDVCHTGYGQTPTSWQIPPHNGG